MNEQIWTNATGDSFYGMKIESVHGVKAPNSNTSYTEITITTTGAIYRIHRTGIDMERRIDPATNTINKSLVARLQFMISLQALQFKWANKKKCIIEGKETEGGTTRVTFTFFSDSLFTIRNIASNPIIYTHRNLVISNNETTSEWQKSRNTLSRIWADKSGGSLHASVNKPIVDITPRNDNFTEISLGGLLRNPGIETISLGFASSAIALPNFTFNWSAWCCITVQPSLMSEVIIFPPNGITAVCLIIPS